MSVRFAPKAMMAFLFLMTLSYSPKSLAVKRYFSFYGHYNYYDDIMSDSNNPTRYIKPDVSLNMDVRMYRVVILILHGGKSIEEDRNYWGLGLKVDLPGFFMMGGNIGELTRKKKRRGLNTSFYWKSYVISGIGNTTNVVGNRMGLSADIMLSKQSFLNLDVGLYSEDGNQYLGLTAGLGYEF